MPEAVVVGAGPGGLAAAAMLHRAGVDDTIVLERSDSVAASWRKHYDRLHLHTVRWLSNLPGYRIPRPYGKWVARDDVIRYLEDYAARHELDIRFGTEVYRIDRADGGWSLQTARGEIQGKFAVVATGHNHTPHLPDWPGRDDFAGELIHASAYRNAEQYCGRDVVVVGSGNTGAEIAIDLAEAGARRVRLSVRTPPHVVLREAFGVPTLALGVLMRRMPLKLVDVVAGVMGRITVGDLSPYGLPKPERGLYTRLLEDDAIPLIDVGLIGCLKRGEVDVVAGVERFDGTNVVLADGSRLAADVVIAATGYLRGLEPLVGHLGVLGPTGRPKVVGAATHPGAPRLYFTGYTNPISGMFRELNIDARRIAKAVAADRN
jgi:putative flavoprotein involved in K+ transport